MDEETRKNKMKTLMIKGVDEQRMITDGVEGGSEKNASNTIVRKQNSYI